MCDQSPVEEGAHEGAGGWPRDWGEEPGLWRKTGRRGLPRMAGAVLENPPAVQESQDTLVQSLGQEDLPEEGMTTRLQYPCLGNPRDRRVCGLQSMGVAK